VTPTATTGRPREDDEVEEDPELFGSNEDTYVPPAPNGRTWRGPVLRPMPRQELVRVERIRISGATVESLIPESARPSRWVPGFEGILPRPGQRAPIPDYEATIETTGAGAIYVNPGAMRAPRSDARYDLLNRFTIEEREGFNFKNFNQAEMGRTLARIQSIRADTQPEAETQLRNVLQQEGGRHLQRRVWDRVTEYNRANPESPLQGYRNNQSAGADFRGGTIDYELAAGSARSVESHTQGSHTLIDSGRQTGVILYAPIIPEQQLGPTIEPAAN